MSRARAASVCLLLCCLFLAPTIGLAAELPAYKPDANDSRADVPDAYKWDLTRLFPTKGAWQEELEAIEGQIPELAAFEGKLTDPKALAKCLGLYFDLHDRTNHVTLYANLALDTAQTDAEAGAMQSESLALLGKLSAAASFIRGEILAMDEATWIAARDAQPSLAANARYVENLRRRASRVLDPQAEKALGLLGDNLWAEIDLNEIPSWMEQGFGALMTDIPWPKVHNEEGELVQMTLSNYGRFRASKDRAVRKEAVEAFFGTLNQYRHAFAAALGGQAEYSVALARARGYDRAIEAYLDKDDVDVAVYDNLIAAVNANLEPLHRYVDLRRKVYGYEEIGLHDLYTSLVASADRDIPFAEARETILEALKPLGPKVGEVLETGMDPASGWIDLYPHKGKGSGAFSASAYGVAPYVKMNYQDSLNDMSTLAHEFGHALHSHLAMKAQPYSSFRYPPFLAEIASTCKEALLTDYLIANAKSDEERAYLIAEQLEAIRTTIYRQTLFAEFERAVHAFVEAGTPVTADLLEKTYAQLIRNYYGPNFAMGENDGMEWAYIPHLYYKFYVFTYATGLSSGIALAEKIKSEGEPAAEGFLEMLEGGASAPPLELLKRAGVDMSQPDAVTSALELFDRRVKELEQILLK
jgi:oligoendopeptidase F